MNIALFDLDNTLLAGDSDVEWPRYLIGKGVLDADHYNRENDRFYADYKAGTLDIQAFLDFQLAPLAGRDRAEQPRQEEAGGGGCQQGQAAGRRHHRTARGAASPPGRSTSTTISTRKEAAVV